MTYESEFLLSNCLLYSNLLFKSKKIQNLENVDL